MDDERIVAVKKLGDAIPGEDEFWAEVSVIGRICHMSLIRMWGFCSEKAHKLLVSEFIENGSLDKILFDGKRNGGLLCWKESRVLNWVMDCVDAEEEVELVERQLCLMLKEKLGKGEDSWIKEFVDSRLNGEFNYKQALLMVEIAVSCLEDERSKRPSMDSVVEVLLSCHDEGDSHFLMSI
ncbi:uncharacterized protein A4U43_C02F850 [Asparagus officinalis]|uniref:Serine-threonine/tyrosine-protein kinase catalytic domain-containing protein n=1 Tax=Asparagus officinalis TaxID=4686 RepID=A0A5P1FFQ0_ASPOF|nr:uncharacterized protein A4U43_C02F850 [Asparagus officinalis]